MVHHILLGAHEGHGGLGDRRWCSETRGVPLAKETIRLFAMETEEQRLTRQRQVYGHGFILVFLLEAWSGFEEMPTARYE